MQSENRPLHCAQNATISVLSLFPTLHNVSIRRYSLFVLRMRYSVTIALLIRFT